MIRVMENDFKICSDPEIARNYKQTETKVKYSVQFGIAEQAINTPIKEFSKTPFIFKFYEATTSQIKKQYNRYIQYRSSKHGKVLSAYVGSLFLGHCDHQQLVEHLTEFGSKLNWDSSYLIRLDMDGPNVSKAFEDKLLNCLKEDNETEFLKLLTCLLHKVHNAFHTELKEFSFDFNTFAVAVHSFF